jgi:hypothetical protein
MVTLQEECDQKGHVHKRLLILFYSFEPLFNHALVLPR